MRPIGGYFELELAHGQSHHPDAIALNTGRNCLEYVLRARHYRHVYVPYYTCEVVLEPLQKLGVTWSFYGIDRHLELAEDIRLQPDEALLATNYYGLKQAHIEALAARYGQQLIVDNTQAFFARRIDGIDTFYTCRKFFGVPDGAYLYCDKPLDLELEQDQSWERMDYLLKRVDLSPEAGYNDFRARSKQLVGNNIRRMSALTQRMMASIDYDCAAQRRRENYAQLDAALHMTNGIHLQLDENAVPMVYPYLADDIDLRKRLIDNKIYVAQYWPNVLDWSPKDSIEQQLTTHLAALPIDQRYGTAEMEHIITLINH